MPELTSPFQDNWQALMYHARNLRLPDRLPGKEDVKAAALKAKRVVEEGSAALKELGRRAAEGHRATWRMLDDVKRMREERR